MRRVILVAVLAVLVGLTSCDDGETERPTTTAVPTTTTSTLPLDLAAFLVSLDAYEAQIEAFLGDVQGINSDWEGRQITQGEARASFEAVMANIATWENEVAGAADVPAALADAHLQLVFEAEQLGAGVDGIIAGLEAPDDGTTRRRAVVDFESQVAVVLGAVDALQTLASPAGTPDGGSDTTAATKAPVIVRVNYEGWDLEIYFDPTSGWSQTEWLGLAAPGYEFLLWSGEIRNLVTDRRTPGFTFLDQWGMYVQLLYPSAASDDCPHILDTYCTTGLMADMRGVVDNGIPAGGVFETYWGTRPVPEDLNPQDAFLLFYHSVRHRNTEPMNPVEIRNLEGEVVSATDIPDLFAAYVDSICATTVCGAEG